MTKNRRSGVRSLLRAGLATAVPIAMLIVASPASAVEHHPTGEYAPFADCPLSNPGTEACLLGKTESGEFVIGKERVPIVNTVTLQGGTHETTGETAFIGAEDGNTLSKSPQKVPGGLAGLIRCNEISDLIERIACEVAFENGVTGVTATTELAAPASAIKINANNLLSEVGVALSLPVKVHLENPLLGGSCYIGSNAHPIVIDLTTGSTSPPPPNASIKGSVGEVEVNEAITILTLRNNVLVNNSFAAPGVQGCGGLFAFLLDPIIDAKLGLPAAAGHNTAILKGTLKEANAPAVKESE